MKKTISFVLLLGLISFVVFPAQKIKAASALDLATAFEATSATSSSYSGDDGASAVLSSFGNISPRQGGNFALLSTGVASATGDVELDYDPAGPDGDISTLTLNFLVPADMNSILFDFYFISQEYPEWVGSEYNDKFQAIITGSSRVSNGTNIALDPNGNVIDVNSVTFKITQGHSDIVDTSFANDGGTGWVIAGAPVAPGDNISISFSVEDVSDGIVTSDVLLDNFRFDQGSVEAGVQSRIFFNQSVMNISSCGSASLKLYSSIVTSSDLILNITNSDDTVLSISKNQLTIPAYKSQTSENLSITTLKDGSATLSATADGFNVGTITINSTNCSVSASTTTLPVTGSSSKPLLWFLLATSFVFVSLVGLKRLFIRE